MPKASSFSPLQLFTPIQLIFCLVLFFLPWIQLTCTLPPEMTKSAPKEELEKMKKETGIDPTKPIGMVNQSGLQIATGEASVASDMKKLEEKAKAEAGAGGMNMNFGAPKVKEKLDDGAPLLFLYPVALVAGIALGFIPWANVARKLILLGCCLGAFGVVGLQTAIGFPLEKELKKQNEAITKMGGMGGFAPEPKAKTTAKESDVFKVSWKIPLYLTFLLLLGAAGTSLLGPGGMGKKPKRKVYDFDDEDEEDDRPRKKKRPVAEYDDDEEEVVKPKKRRRDEDDEEEERPKPKKKPAFEVVEDDEPPKKPARPAGPPTAGDNPFDFDEEQPKKKPRRRDDDDDEDDRPRKKRRRDDD